MDEEKTGPLLPRNCGKHCPEDNVSDSTTKNCRICKKSYHLPCYGILQAPNRLFVSDNIVFVCDGCLVSLDDEHSPKRKQNVQSILKQSVLGSSSSGGFTLQSPSQPIEQNKQAKKPTNEQMYALMLKIFDKVNNQTDKIDEIGVNVCEVGNRVIESKQTSNDIYNIVHSRMMLREQQDLRDLAKQVFHPNGTETVGNVGFGPDNARVYPTLSTPRTQNRIKSKPNTPKPKLYSTVIKSTLPVTPQPEAPSQRKKEQHITLIDNSSDTTIKSVKIPTPKQGKKDVQIGRAVEERQIVPRNSNPLSKSIWISKFHPETTPEELENYIVEHTEVKDKSKFKCSKLVKKDQDVTNMSFVSFKIDVTPENFGILIAPENWPQNKHVREFIKMAPPKPTLADFVPQKPSNSASINATENAAHHANDMDIGDESLNGGAGVSDSSSSNVNGNNKHVTTPTKNA